MWLLRHYCTRHVTVIFVCMSDKWLSRHVSRLVCACTLRHDRAACCHMYVCNLHFVCIWLSTICHAIMYVRRTPRIRWKKVLWHLTEFVMSVFICIMIGKTFLRPTLELIPTDPPKLVGLTALPNLCCYCAYKVLIDHLNILCRPSAYVHVHMPEWHCFLVRCHCRYVLKSLIQFVFCGPFILLLMATCIVQGWMNFTAELARFADRQFYGVRCSQFASALDSHGEGGMLTVSTY